MLGLREVLKHTKLKKIKSVIVAPNLERISTEGILFFCSVVVLSDIEIFISYSKIFLVGHKIKSSYLIICFIISKIVMA